jgi:predicted MFS family arabinose efflux permease
MVALWGGPATFIIIGVSYGLAAIVLARTPEPALKAASSGRLLTDAWEGLIYTWRNRTLRGLGFSISVLNLANGAFTILVPVLVLDRFHLPATVVGIVFAVQGLTGIISAVVFGREDTRGRERTMLAVPMVICAFAMALLLMRPTFTVLVVVMAITGLLNGPIDIALFTLRQRRTHANWTGRAFAVSMSFNYVGTPVGSAVAGILASRSTDATIWFAVITCVLAAAFALSMIPSFYDNPLKP